jgi:L-2-hydroxyglutarate oxidase LhgO
MTRRIVVIGGGLVGLGTAYKLLRANPDLQVSVIEKEPGVACHQSGHNSGALHAGLAYTPGSLKARLARSGLRQMIEFCQRQNVPYEQCGKLVVASGPVERQRLRDLHARGTANGLRGLAWLEGEQVREIEPHARAEAALHVPEEGIVDYGAAAAALAAEVRQRGGTVHAGTGVFALVSQGAGWVVQTTAGDFAADVVVNCAGLQSDLVARMAGVRPGIRIVPFRGEYYRLRPEREHLVRHLIYPAPDPRVPFLGVHFTRRVGGGILAGPNAVLALAREGYRRRDVNVREVASFFAWPGWWRFAARYRALCVQEALTSLSAAAFARRLQRLVPEVRAHDLIPAGAGVRAQALTADGRLVDDFVIHSQRGAVHVLNAPSPAATACLAIADHIVERVPGASINPSPAHV